jgi:ribose transport system substrate-binding protein
MRTQYPNINIIGTAEGGNNMESGFNAMQNILQAHPQIDGVFTHDPFSAQGQAQAILNAGRRDVRIILASGVDFTSIRYFEQNPNTIFKGGGLYPPSMAGDGIRTLIKVLQGETVPRVQLINAGMLLFENLNEWRHLVPEGS